MLVCQCAVREREVAALSRSETHVFLSSDGRIGSATHSNQSGSSRKPIATNQLPVSLTLTPPDQLGSDNHSNQLASSGIHSNQPASFGTDAHTPISTNQLALTPTATNRLVMHQRPHTPQPISQAPTTTATNQLALTPTATNQLRTSMSRNIRSVSTSKFNTNLPYISLQSGS